MKLKNVVGRLAALLPAVLLTGGLLVAPGLASAQGAPGAEACAQCHADTVKHFQSLAKHGVKTDMRTPAATGGCATCHGDATAHIKAGGGKGTMKRLDAKDMPADEKNGVCLGCHKADPQRMHWGGSVHAARDVACVSCHKLHQTDKVRDKLTQSDVCFACHKEQRVQINKPSRHPILEGKVSCSDCHNVHGNNPKQMVKTSVVETCWQCHLEKRGPFVHNHQPVTEDCTICHQPHGTTIANLLKSRPPFLCQDCHGSSGHPSQIAGIPDARTPGGTSRWGTVGRGCLNCHTNIHGSNSTQNSATAGRFRR
jgi:DmsE family decaheme c-type cytochrome